MIPVHGQVDTFLPHGVFSLCGICAKDSAQHGVAGLNKIKFLPLKGCISSRGEDTVNASKWDLKIDIEGKEGPSSFCRSGIQMVVGEGTGETEGLWPLGKPC